MSVSEDRGRPGAWAFLRDRVRRDLQFSNIFLVDFCVAAAYAIATLFFSARNTVDIPQAREIALLVLAYIALHIGKILLIVHLEKQGGDARQFVGSDQLVTGGVYALSRNPVYLISLVQSAIWSLGLVVLTAQGGDQWLAIALGFALLYAHYWGQDRLIIPNEEAALLQRHPQAFPAYCARVNRWFGRKA